MERVLHRSCIHWAVALLLGALTASTVFAQAVGPKAPFTSAQLSEPGPTLPVFTCPSTPVFQRFDAAPPPELPTSASLDKAGAVALATKLAKEQLGLDGMGPPRVATGMIEEFDATDLKAKPKAEVEEYFVRFRHLLAGIPLEGDEAELTVKPKGSGTWGVTWTKGIRETGSVKCLSADEVVALAKARGFFGTVSPADVSRLTTTLCYKSVVAPDGRAEIRPHWMLKMPRRRSVYLDAVQPPGRP